MNNIIISTRIRLARNLPGFPFPHKLTPKDAAEIIRRAADALAPVKNDFTLVKMSETDGPTKQALAERSLLSPDAMKDNNCALFINKDNTAQITVGEEDHIRIQTLRRDDNIEAAFDLANKLDDLLDERLNFAYSEKYGYLTTCLTNTGTGLRASYMLHLPMLERTGQIKTLAQEISRFGMIIRGSHGEGTEAVGSLYQVSNQITLGKSEEEIIKELKNITNQIIKREEALREKIKTDNNMADMIFRSLGILKYCRTIDTKEAMEHLSNIKLGIDAGRIKDKEDNIYDIMISVQPANIAKRIGEPATGKELCAKRAEYLNKAF